MIVGGGIQSRLYSGSTGAVFFYGAWLLLFWDSSSSSPQSTGEAKGLVNFMRREKPVSVDYCGGLSKTGDVPRDHDPKIWRKETLETGYPGRRVSQTGSQPASRSSHTVILAICPPDIGQQKAVSYRFC